MISLESMAVDLAFFFSRTQLFTDKSYCFELVFPPVSSTKLSCSFAAIPSDPDLIELAFGTHILSGFIAIAAL